MDNKYKELMMERLLYIINNSDTIGYYLGEEKTLKSLEYLLLDDSPLEKNIGYFYLVELDKKNKQDTSSVNILLKVYCYVNNELMWNDIKPKKLQIINEYIKLANKIYKQDNYIYCNNKINRDTLSDVNSNSFINKVYDDVKLYVDKYNFTNNDVEYIRNKVKEKE